MGVQPYYLRARNQTWRILTAKLVRIEYDVTGILGDLEALYTSCLTQGKWASIFFSSRQVENQMRSGKFITSLTCARYDITDVQAMAESTCLTPRKQHVYNAHERDVIIFAVNNLSMIIMK